MDSTTSDVQFWAFMEASGNLNGVYALVFVLPLSASDALPYALSYQEQSPPVPIAPSLSLTVREDNDWRTRHPRLRIRSMNFTVSDGYEAGKDVLSLKNLPGFDVTWLEHVGTLVVAAASGYAFTDDAASDYDDGHLEEVDVTEFLSAASATIHDFENVMREVTFQSAHDGGSTDRSVELSVAELLTADVIGVVASVHVVNTMGPPVVLASKPPMYFVEKSPASLLDRHVQVPARPGWLSIRI